MSPQTRTRYDGFPVDGIPDEVVRTIERLAPAIIPAWRATREALPNEKLDLVICPTEWGAVILDRAEALDVFGPLKTLQRSAYESALSANRPGFPAPASVRDAAWIAYEIPDKGYMFVSVDFPIYMSMGQA